ncbi:MAG: HlyD family efflux transporter periplasmic adaptor subunit, partial [Nitrospinae bacterium]|nr:HlyD family efflux transporter periplasmic adaptor subunit [Nitrospinota bacterium]
MAIKYSTGFPAGKSQSVSLQWRNPGSGVALLVVLRSRVFITRQIFPEAVELISGVAEAEVWPLEEPPSPGQLREKISSIDGLLANIMDRIDGPTLQAAHRLKVVSQMGVGVDNIDVAEATRRGVLVGNTPFVLAKANYDVAKANVDVGVAAIKQQEATLELAVRNEEFTTIVSPVKGTIIDRRVNVGQTVVGSFNTPSLFLIAKDLRRMEVWASVNEADIGQLKVGMPVRF